MGYQHELNNNQKREFGRFSGSYTPDSLQNNLGFTTENLIHFDASTDAVLRADTFGKDSRLSVSPFEAGITSSQWTAATSPSAETNDSSYMGTAAQRAEIGRYALVRMNNLQGERVMMESMGIDTEGVTAPNGYEYKSFAEMINDSANARLRPTDAEIARFEELTSFDKNGEFGNTDHSASAVRDRLHVPEHNREAFAEFRDKYLADRGMEYDAVTKTAEQEGAAAERRAEMTVDRDVPSQTQSFSQGFGGMADSFVAQHEAQQSTQRPQFGAAAGRTMTQDGPEFG